MKARIWVISMSEFGNCDKNIFSQKTHLFLRVSFFVSLPPSFCFPNSLLKQLFKTHSYKRKCCKVRNLTEWLILSFHASLSKEVETEVGREESLTVCQTDIMI